MNSRPSELVPSQHGGAAAPLQRVRRRLSLRAAPQACETRHRGAAGTDRNDRQDREPTRWPEPLLRSVATSAHRSRSGAKRTRYARREPPCRTPEVREGGMSGRNEQRKPGTTRGSPRRSRTAKASRISRRAVKSRCAHEWGGWGRLSDDGRDTITRTRARAPGAED
jgi:hypothetical protein